MPLATNLKLKNSTGEAYVTEITFTGVTPGTQSAAQTFRLYNDDADGEVEPATDAYVLARARDPVTDEPLLRGLRAVDERWIELEAPGASSAGVDQPPTGIEPVGRGRALRLAEIPSGDYVEILCYYHPPMSAPEGQVRFTLDAEANNPAIATDQGHSESSRDGVIAGIGDGLHTELVIGGEITATGTPDDKVNFPDIAVVHKGIPWVKLAHQVTLSDLDFASVALGTLDAYWARFSGGAGPNVTTTKSLKFLLASADPDDVPAVPEGEIDFGYALRDDTAAIDSADITSRLWAGRFEPTATALNLKPGPGKARVDNAIAQRHARGLVAMPASETFVWVFVTPDGGYEISTDGSREDPRSQLLYKVPTGVATVTLASLVDYRAPIGPEPVAVELTWSGTLTDGNKAYGVYPSARPGYLRVPRGLIYRHHNNGSGNATGVTKVILRMNGTDVFPSSGTLDRRPSITYNASPVLSTAGLPELLPVEPFAIFEAEIDRTTAYDGTAPAGASLVVLVDQT